MTDTFKMQQEAEARVHAAAEERRRLVGRIPPSDLSVPRRAETPAAFDGEQLTVLLLALLLMQNGAPTELLLALLYIAL